MNLVRLIPLAACTLASIALAGCVASGDPGAIGETDQDLQQCSPPSINCKPPRPGPDLVPVPAFAPGGYGFCNLDGAYNLLVRVKNQGNESAGSSETSVTFSTLEGMVSESLPTPALAPGASTDLTFPIPQGCYSPDCSFGIGVNSTDTVEESDIFNDFGDGTCVS